MRRSFAVLVTVLTVLMLTGAPASAIIGGEPDENRHPYVGAMIVDVTVPDIGPIILCSGTLIAPTVFLTAGHCAPENLDLPPEVELTLLGVTFASVFDESDPDLSTIVPAERMVVHPDFCLACAPGLPGFDTFDVAVIILAEPVTDRGFGTLPEAGTVDTLQKGQRLTAVGYGTQEIVRGGGPPQATLDGRRYFATPKFINAENRLADQFLKLSSNKSPGGGTCFGDSGGPIFLPDQTTVVAVTSFIAPPNDHGWCFPTAYAQRIDLPEVLDWLAQFLD